MFIVRLFRNSIFLIWMVVTLASTTLSFAIWGSIQTAKIATLTAFAAKTAIEHRKQVAKAVGKAKAKARLKRIIVAVPLVGSGAAVAFEAVEYKEWQKENPELGIADYACFVTETSAEVMDEVLQELPETIRPSQETVSRMLPECEEAS